MSQLDPNPEDIEAYTNTHHQPHPAVLGSGGFGVVYKARYGSADVAVKKLLTNGMNPAALSGLLEEGRLLSALTHPNIVQCLGVSTSPLRECIVMELVEGTDLSSFLQDEKRCAELSAIARCDVAYQVASALHYLHSHSIIHRDLKGYNVLLSRSGRGSDGRQLSGRFVAHLCDFGLATVKTSIRTAAGVKSTYNPAASGSSPESQGRMQAGLSRRWAAPEVLDTVPKYSEASDVWSFGMLMYELATSHVPFHTQFDDTVVIVGILRGSLPSFQFVRPEYCVSGFDQLMARCLHTDPSQRPSAAVVAAELLALRSAADAVAS